MSQQLINKTKVSFISRFGSSNPILVASPGRINLIGEHTDYNNGMVFPAAIDKYIVCALSKNNLDNTRLYAVDLDDELIFSLDSLEQQKTSTWANYILGVIDELRKLGKSIQNFDLAFGGNIPIGSGLSSSAALENSVVFGLNELFNLNLTMKEMVLLSQQAEHNFAGVACGIMDQFSNMFGQADKAIFLNCDDLSYDYVPLLMDDYQLLMINSNVNHTLSDSPYNKRKEECAEGLQLLQIKFPQLKSISQASLSQLTQLEESMPAKIYQRCLYVIEENARVKFLKSAIEQNDWETFGQLLYASHNGLQYQYEVSCDELDFLVSTAKTQENVLGSRMMGGGFGGCTINLVSKEGLSEFKELIDQKYSERFGHKADIFSVQISNGTHLVDA